MSYQWKNLLKVSTSSTKIITILTSSNLPTERIIKVSNASQLTINLDMHIIQTHLSFMMRLNTKRVIKPILFKFRNLFHVVANTDLVLVNLMDQQLTKSNTKENKLKMDNL